MPDQSSIPPTEAAEPPNPRMLPVEAVVGIRVKQTRTTYYFGDFRINDVQKRRITMGRHPENDIVLESTRISRFHCVLQRMNRLWTIRDTQSSNWTIVGRHEDPTMHRLHSDRAIALSVNMIILLPEYELLPVGEHGRVGLLALTQRRFRVAARLAYGSPDEAGKKIGCAKSTVSQAVKDEYRENHRPLSNHR